MTSRSLFALLVAILLAACTPGADDPPATTGSTSAPSHTTTTTAPATDPGPEEEADPDDPLVLAVGAFQSWVEDLAAGNHQEAWEAMAPTSRAAVGEQLFFDSLVYEMSEGWGSWSAAEDLLYRLDEDEAGRTLLWVSGTISPEGITEDREVAVPIAVTETGHQVSPFEEFGNVAEGVAEELEGVAPPPVPVDSGTGRRVVYSNPEQRVWLVDDDGIIVDSYLVSGKAGVPEPGTYQVYSRSEAAFAGHDDITMRYMVRFAHGENLPIGFHSIPNGGDGAPLQSEEQLGEYHSAGCVRQSIGHAAFLYEWAVDGTTVVVLG